MNGYVCFYNKKRIEVYANTSYEAQQKVIEQEKVPKSKRYAVSVTLAEKDGKPVTHVAVD